MCNTRCPPHGWEDSDSRICPASAPLHMDGRRIRDPQERLGSSQKPTRSIIGPDRLRRSIHGKICFIWRFLARRTDFSHDFSDAHREHERVSLEDKLRATCCTVHLWGFWGCSALFHGLNRATSHLAGRSELRVHLWMALAHHSSADGAKLVAMQFTAFSLSASCRGRLRGGFGRLWSYSGRCGPCGRKNPCGTRCFERHVRSTASAN